MMRKPAWMWLGLGLAWASAGAAAQTTVMNSGGTVNSVPVITSTTATVNGSTVTEVGSSPISVSNGNVGIGTTIPIAPLDVETSGTSTIRGINSGQTSNDANGSFVNLLKSRAGAPVQNGDNIGSVAAQPFDGTQYDNPARIRFMVNGSVATGSVPTDITFLTGTGGGGAEAMRVTSTGFIGIGTTNPQGLLEVDGSLLHSGTTVPAATTSILPYNNSNSVGTSWDVVNGQLTNPSTNFGIVTGYLGAPVVNSTDGTARIAVGRSFGPSLNASGPSSGNYVYGVSANGIIGSSSTTSGFTSLYGGSFGAGIGPNVPSGTAVGNVAGIRSGPDIESGSVGVVRGLWVTPQFGSSGQAPLTIPQYYGLVLEAPTYLNQGATITNNYGISQQDSTAKNYFAGSIGIGAPNPQAALEINGNLRFTADGSVQKTAWTGILCGGDYAEDMRASGKKESYEPGDVLVLAVTDNSDIQKSAEPYSTMVAGIFATKPGVVGRRDAVAKSTDNVPMAMVGVVPTKVSAENGPIRKGDLLVTSSTPGYAMKGTDRSRMLGAVIGKAMGSLDSGTGAIEVLVTLQ